MVRQIRGMLRVRCDGDNCGRQVQAKAKPFLWHFVDFADGRIGVLCPECSEGKTAEDCTTVVRKALGMDAQQARAAS